MSNTDNQCGMPPSAGTKSHIDLANLTQEQFDRAMQNPGACSYSAPCIIGAMMPQELRDHLKSAGRDRERVYTLAADGMISISGNVEGLLPIEQVVQNIFDSLVSLRSHHFNERLERLAEILPHIDVLKHKLPVPVV